MSLYNNKLGFTSSKSIYRLLLTLLMTSKRATINFLEKQALILVDKAKIYTMIISNKIHCSDIWNERLLKL